MRTLRSVLGCFAPSPPAIHVDTAARQQTVEGWGTSLAWWGTVVGRWPDPTRNAIADLLFSPTAGLGLGVVRYNIGGGDDPAHRHMRPGGAVPGYQPSPGMWDWNADANQRWALLAARQRGATIFEAFANSPPYWMTRSGCAAGADDGGDNLRADSVDGFAAYLAEVVARFRDEWGLTFRTVAPFNEPAGTWWKSSNRQEGCHFSHQAQVAVIARLGAHLAARGLRDTAISAADDYSIDETIATLSAYDAPALAPVAQVNTHSYGGARRADLRELAASHSKRLWMSEFGTGAGPHDHTAMGPALALAEQIGRDMNDLQPAAWVYWQAVEDEGANNWGLIHAPFAGASEQFWLTKQYHAMAHFSTFIRPGYTVLGLDSVSTLAAHDQGTGTLVLVYTNSTAQDAAVRFDLSRCGLAAGSAAVAAYRTSASDDMARLPDLALVGDGFSGQVAAESITTYVVRGNASG